MIQLTEAQRRNRDRLFAELSDGALDPPEAERRAAELGLGELTPRLDPARFDPMRETHWTLAMAVAWIAWADLERVRDCLPRWRERHQSWFWRECIEGDGNGGLRERSGWLLEQTHKGEAPLMFLSLCEAIEASEGAPPDAAQRSTIHDARADLWAKLDAADLAAIAMVNGTPSSIPKHEWAFLQLIEHQGADVLRAGRDMFMPATTYNANEVLLRRDDVLRIWPAPTPTAADETSAEKELRALVASGALPKSGEWQAKAKAKIGTRGAQRVWGKVAKDIPALASPAGKPKARRDGAGGSKARRQVNP